MYCNKCNSALKDGDHICPNCGFDNDATIDLSSVVRKISKKEEKKSRMIIITILLIILCIGIVVIYLLNGASEDDIIPVTTNATTTTENKELKKFKFNDIYINYPTDLFAIKDNIIYLEKNDKIFINFSIIDAKEYQDQINGNECLDYTLNNLLVKTYAGDDFYSYIFMLNDKYYNISVHYIDEPTIYTESVQVEINRVLNTIKQK